MITIIEKKELFIKNLYLYSDSTSQLSLQNTAFTKEKKDWTETLDSSFQSLTKKSEEIRRRSMIEKDDYETIEKEMERLMADWETTITKGNDLYLHLREKLNRIDLLNSDVDSRNRSQELVAISSCLLDILDLKKKELDQYCNVIEKIEDKNQQIKTLIGSIKNNQFLYSEVIQKITPYLSKWISCKNELTHLAYHLTNYSEDRLKSFYNHFDMGKSEQEMENIEKNLQELKHRLAIASPIEKKIGDYEWLNQPLYFLSSINALPNYFPKMEVCRLRDENIEKGIIVLVDRIVKKSGQWISDIDFKFDALFYLKKEIENGMGRLFKKICLMDEMFKMEEEIDNLLSGYRSKLLPLSDVQQNKEDCLNKMVTIEKNGEKIKKHFFVCDSEVNGEKVKLKKAIALESANRPILIGFVNKKVEDTPFFQWRVEKDRNRFDQHHRSNRAYQIGQSVGVGCGPSFFSIWNDAKIKIGSDLFLSQPLLQTEKLISKKEMSGFLLYSKQSCNELLTGQSFPDPYFAKEDGLIGGGRFLRLNLPVTRPFSLYIGNFTAKMSNLYSIHLYYQYCRQTSSVVCCTNIAYRYKGRLFQNISVLIEEKSRHYFSKAESSGMVAQTIYFYWDCEKNRMRVFSDIEQYD